MLRFLPDSWFEGLLRPLLLADPAAGLYYEEGAPDWRFAVLVALLLLALVTGRLRRLAQAEQVRMLILLAAIFYAWTFTIGNGRYFIAGLLLAGPLVVMAWRWLPGTRAFRWALLLGLMLIQAQTVASMYRPSAWAMASWREGPAAYVAPNAVRDKPAVFVTITAPSFSVLVPSFHPQSRWTNLAGQVEMTPDRAEYTQARALLRTPMDKYLVVPATEEARVADAQPGASMRRQMQRKLTDHGLALLEADCHVLRSSLVPQGLTEPDAKLPMGAFWVCPIEERVTASPSGGPSPTAMDDVFERIEAYCPRFFRPGTATTKRNADHWLRYYLSSDTRIFIEDNGLVTYRYFRSYTPTVAGTADEIRQGKLDFDCARLPGRYQPPWASR